MQTDVSDALFSVAPLRFKLVQVLARNILFFWRFECDVFSAWTCDQENLGEYQKLTATFNTLAWMAYFEFCSISEINRLSRKSFIRALRYKEIAEVF